ncbi:hypothetical protein MPSEU_000926300 [Mayamaea pseudoterrestris]|nr:hypothetical protein MPSEU_000926300 [Mayamaea pseudoterrestris]
MQSRRPNAQQQPDASSSASTTALSSHRNNNHQNKSSKTLSWKQWLMQVIRSLAKVILWPLKYFLQLTFPSCDTDGLSAAASAKATLKFCNYMQQQSTINNEQLWATNGFAHAKQQAAEQSKLILLVLHSPLSPDSTTFCHSHLHQPQLQSFASHSQILPLGLDVHTGQGAQLASVLQASAFPLLALLQPNLNATTSSSASLTILFRAEGESLMSLCNSNIHGQGNATTTTATSANTLHTYLQLALTRHETMVAEAIARRMDRAQDVALRQAQDDEYQETLRLDREKQALAAEKALEQRMEEQSRVNEEQAQRNVIQQAKQLVGDEPAQGGCMVRFVLPSGTKLNRRFATDATIKVLKAYLTVYCYENDITMGIIGLSTSFPRKTYNEENEQQLTLEEAGLTGQAVLMVQDLDA